MIDMNMVIANDIQENNVIQTFMSKVHTQSARDALAIVDELADLVIFHARVRENAEEMMKPWSISDGE